MLLGEKDSASRQAATCAARLSGRVEADAPGWCDMRSRLSVSSDPGVTLASFWLPLNVTTFGDGAVTQLVCRLNCRATLPCPRDIDTLNYFLHGPGPEGT